MSFKDFERGVDPKDINRTNEDAFLHKQMKELSRRWEESEYVLDILRTKKPLKQRIEQEVVARWAKMIQK